MDEEDFWLRHLRLGVVVFALGTFVALVYVVAGEPVRRGTLLAFAVGAAVSTVVVAALPHRAIVRSAHARRFFYAWTFFSVSYLLVVVAVDGGGASPMATLLVLPVIYSGLAYPPAVVVAVAVGAGAGYEAIAVLGPDVPVGTAVVVPGSLLAIGLTAASVSQSRQRSIAQLLELHERLAESARIDGLTGCLARGPFHEAVAAELARARRTDRPLAVIVADLDHFKAVNDLHGHLAGDECLRQVGAVLRAAVREVDAVGRLGGDEFAVLLPETDGGAAAIALERLRLLLDRAGVPASLGAAVAVIGDGVDAVVGRADLAMYEDKRRRRSLARSERPEAAPPRGG